ncbi:hypothetical protein KI387_034086, partial [Taxus chinensis]
YINGTKGFMQYCGHIEATSKSATGCSPFQLAYGIDPVLPIEFDIPTVRVIKKERMDEGDS